MSALAVLAAVLAVFGTALVVWLVRKIDKSTEPSPDCEECSHPIHEHDKYGHCEDECPCRLCFW